MNNTNALIWEEHTKMIPNQNDFTSMDDNHIYKNVCCDPGKLSSDGL